MESERISDKTNKPGVAKASQCGECGNFYPQGCIDYKYESGESICTDCSPCCNHDDESCAITAETCIGGKNHEYDTDKQTVTYNRPGDQNGIRFQDVAHPKYDAVTKTYVCLVCGLAVRETYFLDSHEIVEDSLDD